MRPRQLSITRDFGASPISPHSKQANQLGNQTLLDALVISLQPPLRTMQFEVNTTALACTLSVGDGYRTVRTESGRDALITGNIIVCKFEADVRLPLRFLMQQMNISRSIYFPLIDPLLTRLMNHPEPPNYGSIVRADDLPETEQTGVSAPKVPRPKRKLK